MADDILINHIFMRLPVKSLLCCRCVCKQWRELLTNLEFVNMHVKNQLRNHQKLLIRSVENINDRVIMGYDGHGLFYSVDIESADAVRLPDFPLKDHFISPILGSCNGMVCMIVVPSLKKNSGNYFKKRYLLFWNPSTRDYKLLPDTIDHPTSDYDLFLFVGFGYVSSMDDYKFVRVDKVSRNPDIFSLKSNSWKTILSATDNYSIKPAHQDLCSYNIGSALDGSIYWLVPSNKTIVLFDLKGEEFRELSLPCDLQIDLLSMRVVGCSLYIINICKKNDEVGVWSMFKEEENKEKYYWIKLTTLPFCPSGFDVFSRVHPLAFMKDGKVLGCVYHHNHNFSTTTEFNFFLVDLKTKRVEDFTIRGISYDYIRYDSFERQMTYIDSLVSPNYY